MAIYHQNPLVRSKGSIKRPAVKNDKHDCSKCDHAYKIDDDENYVCDAVVYDPWYLTCFVPRENSEE